MGEISAMLAILNSAESSSRHVIWCDFSPPKAPLQTVGTTRVLTEERVIFHGVCSVAIWNISRLTLHEAWKYLKALGLLFVFALSSNMEALVNGKKYCVMLTRGGGVDVHGSASIIRPRIQNTGFNCHEICRPVDQIKNSTGLTN